MTTRRFNFDHITIMTLTMIAVLPFMAMSPVKAVTMECQDQFEAVRLEAESAEPKAAAKALRAARIGEKICLEGSRLEANRKFREAHRHLDKQQLAYQR